jgi:RNA-directed DNA polymerase
VTENQGKQTPGVDRVTGDLGDAGTKCHRHRHPPAARVSAAPLRRVYIAKSNVKRRGLGIPTMMKDRAMQALYLPALDPIADATGVSKSQPHPPRR